MEGPDLLLDKVPPHNLDMEAALLGEMMEWPDKTIPAVVTLLCAADFFRPEHGILFGALVEMYDQKKPIDLPSVEEALRADGRLERIGGRDGILDSFDLATVPSNAYYHASVVKEKSTARRLIALAGNLIRGVLDGQKVKDLVEATDAALMELRDSEAVRGERLATIVKRLAGRLSSDTPLVPGLKTGFADLDKWTGGLHKGELAVLASRPGYGKSALACNIVENVAAQGHKVALMSLEMASEELGLRFLSSMSGVNLRLMRTQVIGKEAAMELQQVVAKFEDEETWIEDCASMSILALRSRVRQLVAERGIELAVVDYLQLVEGTRNRGDSRQQEIGTVSRGLKFLARECNIPVLAVAALRRLPPGQNQQPTIQDLRESGDIEQDADEVLLLDRPVMRLKYKSDAWEAAKGKAELQIAKQRNGPTTIVHLTWRGECVRFESAARNDPQPQTVPGTEEYVQDYHSQGQDPSPDRGTPY